MQPANGTGYYPVSGAETGNHVPHGPTNFGSKEAAEPTTAPTAVKVDSGYEAATVDSDDGSSTMSDDVEGMDSSMVGPSTMSNSSAAGLQSTASSQQSSESSQSASTIQSPASAESSTESQSGPGAQIIESSQSSASSPESGSDSGVSTLTTAIVAPTQGLDQSGAPAETADGGETSADGLAQSFSAVPRAVLLG